MTGCPRSNESDAPGHGRALRVDRASSALQSVRLFHAPMVLVLLVALGWLDSGMRAALGGEEEDSPSVARDVDAAIAEATRLLTRHDAKGALQLLESPSLSGLRRADVLALHALALIRSGRHAEGLAEASAPEVAAAGGPRLASALEASREVVAAEPSLQRGLETKDPRELAPAIEHLQRAMTLDPENLEIRKTLGWLYVDKTFQPRLAVAHLEAVASAWPEDVGVQKLLGLAYLGAGCSCAALETLLAAAEHDPADRWIRVNVGKARAALGDACGAEVEYRRVLLQDPANGPARLGLAELRGWDGQLCAAHQLVDSILQAEPRDGGARALRGDLFRWDGRLRCACREYRALLADEPWNGLAREGLCAVADARRIGLGGRFLDFEDSGGFHTRVEEGSIRVPVGESWAATLRAAHWTFEQGPVHAERTDEALELAWRPSRALEVRLNALNYDVDGLPLEQSYGGLLHWSPRARVDAYAGAAWNDPVLDSLGNVLAGLAQDTRSLAIDTKLAPCFGVQAAVSQADYSDANQRVHATAQVSWRVLRDPELFLRLEHDFLDYETQTPAYYSPGDYHSFHPKAQVSKALGRFATLQGLLEIPYLFEEVAWGFSLRLGITVRPARHLDVSLTYTNVDLPTAAPWSGEGVELSVHLLL